MEKNMINNKTIAVVVPCYNEAKQIGFVIETMPNFVDRIIIVDDMSSDGTSTVVAKHIEGYKNKGKILEVHYPELKLGRYNRADVVMQEIMSSENEFYTPFEIYNKTPDMDRVILIRHKRNGGVGAAIVTGYKWCRDHNIDCSAVMAGDGQMDPSELESICMPVVSDEVDYVKGNRLIHRSAPYVIPKIRYWGNSLLSMLTKIASGYWHISDTQTGYTAISLQALKSIKIYKIYPRYGMPNDLLVKLNMAYCTVKEVGIKPVYNVGEESKMKLWKVIPTISKLLVKSFFKRLLKKYFMRDFHPLFLFYSFSILLFIINVPFAVKILIDFSTKGRLVSSIDLIIFTTLFVASFQSFFFGMWMDIQDNERLYK
jgi:glycosyltransferase involved in cell wall biosynthesis